MNEIRLLRADEIDVRVGGFNKDKTGGFLLLYKDARVDMAMLDELFGNYGWQRKHEVINGKLFCTVSIYNEKTGEWISKQDVGVESNNDATKGEASDSFKRACFNVGIGRELYTAPFIWINGLDKFDKFKVLEIGYNEVREINQLVIVDDKGKERYRMGKPQVVKSTKAEPKAKSKTEVKKDTDIVKPDDESHGLASEKQLKFIFSLAKQKKYTESIKGYVQLTYNKDNSAQLTSQEASEIIKYLQEMDD